MAFVINNYDITRQIVSNVFDVTKPLYQQYACKSAKMVFMS